MARNDIYINSEASDPSLAVVTSTTNLAAASFPTLVLGDSDLFNFRFTNGSAAPSWAGLGTYGFTLSLAPSAVYADLLVYQNTFTLIAGGWSGRLALTTAEIVAWFEAQNITQASNTRPMSLHARVTDPSGNIVSYAVIRVVVAAGVKAVSNTTTLSADTYVTYPVFSAAIGDQVSANGLGTGVAAAIDINVGTAGSFVVNGGVLGTPSSGTATNLTGLPVSTGVTGLGTGVATALAVNVGSAGAPVVFDGAGGTPSSITLTNATGTAASLTAGTASAVAAANLTGTALPAAVVTSSLTTVGALNSGSITSGFGAIDIGTDAFTAGAGTFSGNTSVTPLVHNRGLFVGADAESANIQTFAFGATPFIYGIRINGTNASKTGTISGNNLYAVSGRGYQTVTSAISNDAARILFQATENFTDTAQGAQVLIQAIANGSATINTVATFTSTGLNSTAIGATTPAAGSFSTLGATGATNLDAGTVSLPGLYLEGETSTGLYRIGANNHGYAVSGAKVLDIASTGLAVTGTHTVSSTVIHTLSATPASAAAAGTVGTISWDADYIYICTATNTWKRVAIATWP